MKTARTAAILARFPCEMLWGVLISFIYRQKHGRGSACLGIRMNNNVTRLPIFPGSVPSFHWEISRGRTFILSKGKPIRFEDILKTGIHDKDTVNITDNDIINLNEAISDHMVKVLRKTRGKIGGHGGAAQLMGLHPATLRHRMRRLNIPFGRGVKYRN